MIKEEGGQNLGIFGVKERVETGLASGTEVPTVTGRACSRHCQKDGINPPLASSPVGRTAGLFPRLLYTFVGLGESWEWVVEGEGSRRVSSRGYSPER